MTAATVGGGGGQPPAPPPGGLATARPGAVADHVGSDLRVHPLWASGPAGGAASGQLPGRAPTASASSGSHAPASSCCSPRLGGYPRRAGAGGPGLPRPRPGCGCWPRSFTRHRCIRSTRPSRTRSPSHSCVVGCWTSPNRGRRCRPGFAGRRGRVAGGRFAAPAGSSASSCAGWRGSGPGRGGVAGRHGCPGARGRLYLTDLALGVCAAVLPLATGAAILRYRLYDLDRIISRTLAYGLLTVLLGLGYVGVVLGLGRLLPPGSSLVVAGAHIGGGRVVPAGPPPHPAGQWTGGSTAAATTPPRPSGPSALACATRSTCAP